MSVTTVRQLGDQYETVAAGQTAQVLGGTGATGDYLTRLIITPSNAATGVVTILDNAISINIHPGGAATPLLPIVVELGIKSVSGAWKVTTGAAVTVVAVGRFS